MILPIYTYGDEILTQGSKDVDLDDTTLPQIIDNMFETMRNTNLGIALAATQVGIPKRIFIVENDEDEEQTFKGAFINPKIIYKGEHFHEMGEPCLSFPGAVLNIRRPIIIKVEWYDKDKNFHSEYFHDIESRIIQHEMDHLDGILIVDRTHPSELKKNKAILEKIRNKKVKTDYKIYKDESI